MSTRLRNRLLAASLLLVLRVPAAPAMESAGYRLDRAAFVGSGGISSSLSFRLTGSAAQSAPTAASASYRMLSGLRHELLRTIAAGDIDGDGAIDLRDAILALGILTSLLAAEMAPEADADGDGRPGLPEVIHILRQSAAR